MKELDFFKRNKDELFGFIVTESIIVYIGIIYILIRILGY